MKHSSIFFFISIALLCFSKTSSAVTTDEAIQHYIDNNYFSDTALLEGVKQNLNAYWHYSDMTPDEYLENIYALNLEGVSSLEGINRLVSLTTMFVEQSSVTDFSPLSGTNITYLNLDHNS